MDKYYFTCTEFKNNYKSVLLDYLNQHVDNEMNDFNKLQIEKYKYGLDFIELIVRPYKFDEIPNYINFELFEDLMCHFKIDNHGILSYQDFYRCYENKNFEFSLDMAFDNKYDFLIKSWNRIIKLLEFDSDNLLIEDISLSEKNGNEKNLSDNPYPLMFISKGVYESFLEYKKHIIDFYIDYSYLKKRLEKENLIHNHKDNDFMNFLFKELKLISQKELDKYYSDYESKLRCLSKCKSENRLNNFNNVFESFLS